MHAHLNFIQKKFHPIRQSFPQKVFIIIIYYYIIQFEDVFSEFCAAKE